MLRTKVMHRGKLFVRGSCLCEDFVLDSLVLQLSCRHVSTSGGFTYLMCLTKAVLIQVIQDFPVEIQLIRKNTIVMGFRNAVQLIIDRIRADKRKQDWIRRSNEGTLSYEEMRELQFVECENVIRNQAMARARREFDVYRAVVMTGGMGMAGR